MSLRILDRILVVLVCLPFISGCGGSQTPARLEESPTGSQATNFPMQGSSSPTEYPTPPFSLRLEGDWPGGAEAAQAEFRFTIPYMIKYLGQPMSRWETLTWTFNPSIRTPGDIGWDAKTDSIHTGPLPQFLEPPQFPGYPRYWNLYQQAEHETAHLFYDIGDDTIQFTFGQWIWEGLALIGQDLAYSEAYGSNMGWALTYDTIANIGWDGVNGVLRDGEKYDRSIVDSNAAAALRLMTEVLSYDTNLDFIRRVNAALLEEYQSTQNLQITPEIFQAILNKVAGERTIDGRKPGDWLFSQPVANNDGALGPRMIVYPFYSVPTDRIHLIPTGFNMAAFLRSNGQRPGETNETGLSDLPFTASVQDSSGRTVRTTKSTTGANGLANLDALSSGSDLNVWSLTPGAYRITVQASYENQTLVGTNFFIVLPLDVTPNDDLMFIVPMNADGSALRPELVDQLSVQNGQIFRQYDGILLLTADPGAEVEIQCGSFSAKISKPVTARLIPLRIP